MEYTIVEGLTVANCTCGNFRLDLIKEKNPAVKIQAHAEVHGAEPEATVIVRKAWAHQ